MNVRGGGRGASGGADRAASAAPVHRRQRKLDGERRALARRPALVRLHRAAVQLDQVLDDRQPQPEAAVAARGRGVRLAEALEHVRQELGRDAVPCR